MKIKTLEQLEIPSEKNAIFVSPKYSSWREMLDYNLATGSDSQDKSTARSQLLNIARVYTSQLLPGFYNQPKTANIIVTGHQPIWHHPGILAKNIIASKFAKQSKGLCIQLVVDHDIGDSDMVLPFSNHDKTLDFIKVPVEKNQRKIPFELRSKPDLKMINDLIGSIAKNCPENFCCQLWSEHLKKHPQISFALKNAGDVITSLQAVLNKALGIEMLYLPTSLMSENDSFFKFAGAIIKNYEKFTDIYNDAVSKNTTHSNCKFLNVDSSGKTALPFWLVTVSGLRTCMYAKTGSSTITISTMSRELGAIDLAGNKIQQLKNILSKHQLSLRPKAVTMMLFVRLFLSDLFIHGTGGGSYKKITNFILDNYYNLKKTDAAIATATAWLPLLKESPLQCDIKTLNQNIRKIYHSPEKYIDKTLLEDDSIKKAIEIKKNMIRQACDLNKSAQQKQDAWKNINKINKRLIKYAQPSIKKFEEKIQLAKQFQHTTEVLNYRQFFFGLFSESFLKDFSKPETEI
ncbi:MAG: hypothetical protein KAS96_00810 [Planctomycetes bacterium]|nr:hypothetical protein [Planctomycetota bacterium]